MRKIESSGSLASASRALVTLLALLCACAEQAGEVADYPWGIDPESLPQTVRQSDFPDLPQGSADRIWGFAGKDLSGKDLTNLSAAFLAQLTFDGNTSWPRPALLPEGFAPDELLEIGKDPGLGVRDLHRQGFTGDGIAVAVVDKPIRHQHSEFEGRIHYYEVFDEETEGRAPHFHGIACASILAGKSVGVAPDATIHYFAVPDVGKNFHFYSIAADKIITVNESLGDGEKIRVVSISDGIGRDDPYRQEWESALERLQQAEIEVIYSSREVFGPFLWGGCPPCEDRNVPSNYEVALMLKGRDMPPETILVPGDYRTTASNKGPSLYIYWGEGGYSWAIPYLAGLAALAWQLAPDLTLAEIEALLAESTARSGDGLRVIRPIRFMELVRAHSRT
jgi:serine protease AprX